MKAFLKKIFNPKETKLWWLYIVLGVALVIIAAMLMPVWPNEKWCFWWDWGTKILSSIIAACIVCYIILFLLKKIIHKQNGVVTVLTIIETVLLGLIALGCILQQFRVINIGGACQILGLALWCRGSVEIFRAYYHQNDSKDKYPVWWLVVSLVFVTFGVWLYLRPLFEDLVILWIFVVLLYIIGLVCFIDAYVSKPAKKK